MRIAILLSMILAIACNGKSGTPKLYKAKEELNFAQFINEKSMPEDPNLTIDKTIVNNNYPIEIALYKDNRFFYNLPNLGSGKGRWTYNDGIIELRAKRTLFDMYIEVYGADPQIKETAIQFSDRFGPNTLKMENSNL